MGEKSPMDIPDPWGRTGSYARFLLAKTFLSIHLQVSRGILQMRHCFRYPFAHVVTSSLQDALKS